MTVTAKDSYVVSNGVPNPPTERQDFPFATSAIPAVAKLL